jgi:hypothetical protein
VQIPIYDFSKHQRLDSTQYLYGAAVVIGMSHLPPNSKAIFLSHMSSSRGDFRFA